MHEKKKNWGIKVVRFTIFWKNKPAGSIICHPPNWVSRTWPPLGEMDGTEQLPEGKGGRGGMPVKVGKIPSLRKFLFYSINQILSRGFIKRNIYIYINIQTKGCLQLKS